MDLLINFLILVFSIYLGIGLIISGILFAILILMNNKKENIFKYYLLAIFDWPYLAWKVYKNSKE